MDSRNVFLISADEWGWTDLRLVIQEMPRLTLMGESMNREEAVWKAQRLQPDIVISAAKLHGVSTRDLLRQLQRDICPSATIIRFSTELDPSEMIEHQDLLLSGHLLWNELTPVRLRACLAALIEGGIILRSRGFINHYVHSAADSTPPVAVNDLDRAILVSMMLDLSAKEIATEHNLSERTVRRRVDVLKERLGVQTLFALGHAAARQGLLD